MPWRLARCRQDSLEADLLFRSLSGLHTTRSLKSPRIPSTTLILVALPFVSWCARSLSPTHDLSALATTTTHDGNSIFEESSTTARCSSGITSTCSEFDQRRNRQCDRTTGRSCSRKVRIKLYRPLTRNNYILFALTFRFSFSRPVTFLACAFDAATASWELGTRAEALLELTTPLLSVFSLNSFPSVSASTSAVESGSDAIGPIFSIATTIVANRSVSNGNVTGPQPLIADTSAAGPASIGVVVLLLNWIRVCHGCAGAATDQLDYLLNVVPKTSDGAISHQVSQVQLWYVRSASHHLHRNSHHLYCQLVSACRSDFVYMVPPFLAYYAVISENKTLLIESYNQIKLYRSYLMDSSAGGMWKHVLLGDGTDDGHWSTGACLRVHPNSVVYQP